MNENKNDIVGNIAWVVFAIIFLYVVFECMITLSGKIKIELLSVETEKIGDTYQGIEAEDGYEYYKVTSTLKNHGKEMLYTTSVYIDYKIKQELHGTVVYDDCKIFDENDNFTMFEWENSLILPAWKTGKKIDIVQIPINDKSQAVRYLNLEVEKGTKIKASQALNVKL